MRVIICILFLFSATGLFAQSSNPVGDSYASSENCYVVTNNIDWQLGAVWFNEQLDLNEPFEIELELNFGNSDSGADGMVFVFQQVGPDAIGDAGGGIGFEGFLPSLGIELDTYNNLDLFDIAADHMAIARDGNTVHASPLNLAGPVQMSATQFNIEDGEDHVFKLAWDPTLQILDVFFDCELRLSYTEDIVNNIFGGNSTVWWGFTGATGGESALQTACISEFALGLESSFTVCAGDPVQLGVVGSALGTYSWEPTTFLDDPTSQTPIATPTESIVYEVTFTNLCGELTVLQTEVEVVELEVDLPELILACDEDIVEVEVDGNALEYTWSNGGDGAIVTETTAGPLTVTGTLGGCSVEATTELVFHPLPNPDGLEGAEFCEGESAVLDASTNNVQSYEWSTDESTPTIEVTESGTYEVVITTEEDCTQSFEVTVEVTPFPEAGLPDEIEACEGEEVILTSNVAETYNWSTGSEEQQITVTEDGNYALIVSSNGCVGTDNVVVTFGTVPLFDLNPPTSLCPDSTATLYLPSSDYSWSLNGVNVTDSVVFDAPGVYDISATDIQSFCSAAISFEIQALENAYFDWPGELLICDGVPAVVQLIADPDFTIVWEDGTEGDLIVVTEPTTLIVSVSNECSTETGEREIIAARCDCPLFVPNSFSPNLDGTNELFYPSLDCEVQDYLFQIFNRWGELIFSSQVQGEGWNGAAPAKTHYAQDGVYSWKITYQVDLADGLEVVDRVGHVVLMR